MPFKKTFKQTKVITYFYGRKYLIRHLISEGGLGAEQLEKETTKALRDMLFKLRNAVVINQVQ